jgi:hypothetical protein
MTIQTILRAAYTAVDVVEWLSDFSESWSRGVISDDLRSAIVNNLAVT